MKELKLKINFLGNDKLSKVFKKVGKSSQELAGNMGDAAKKLKGLKKEHRNIQSIHKLKRAVADNARSLDDAQEKTRRLSDEMRDSTRVTKKQKEALGRAQREVNRLRLAQEDRRRTMIKLKKTLSGTIADTRNLARYEADLKSRMDQTSAAMDKQAAKANKLARARAAYEKTMGHRANMSFVGMAGLDVGRTARNTLGSIVNPGIAFEESMSKVGAVARLDKSSEAFAKLQAQAEDLGATTSFSASEAAQGMGFLAMAGFEANDILAAMPATLALAKAGGTDLAQTADIASNILSGFRMEASEMGRVSDVLAATFTRSNVDLAMLGESMKYVAPIADELGASIEDAAAMSGLLGNVGIQGSQAGTALRAIYNRLSGPPKMAAEAIDQLNLSTRDAQGNLRPMVEIMADVAEKTKGMGNAARVDIFKRIAGTEAGTAFAELINKGGEGEIARFVEVLKSVDGEALNIANKMGDNTAGDIKSLRSAWEGLNITLTQTTAGPMRKMIQSGVEMLRAIRTWVKENPKLAGTLLKVAAAGAAIITVLGGMALAVAGILGPFAMAKMAITTLGLKFGLLTGAIKAMGLALMTTPIGWIVGGIAALVAIGAALYEGWAPFREMFDDLWGSLPGWIKTALSAIGTLMAPLKWIGQAVGSLFGDDEPVKKLAKAGATAAGVTAATVATPAMATKPVERAVVQAVQAQGDSHITINIQAASGADGQKIADIVRTELEKLERDRKRGQRARLYD